MSQTNTTSPAESSIASRAITELEAHVVALESQLAKVMRERDKLRCDAGVVLLSVDGPTHTEIHNGQPIQVYDHAYFSPLGDALIELYQLAGGRMSDHECTFNAENGVSFERHTNGDVTVHMEGVRARLSADTWISAISMMSAPGEAAHEMAKSLHRGIGDGV